MSEYMHRHPVVLPIMYNTLVWLYGGPITATPANFVSWLKYN